jgi:choline kinase
MKAIILAAGRGSRLQGLTDHKPKCLVELDGRPLLEHQLEALRNAGISEIGIVTGYRKETLGGRGLIEFHNPRWDQTNMVSSLACADCWLLEEPVVISYSDIFYEPSAVISLIKSSAELAITFDPDWLLLWSKRFENPLEDAETFRLNIDGHLTEIGQRPKSAAEVQGQYMGLLRLTPLAWREISRIREILKPQERDRMDMTGTLQRIIEAGRVAITAIPYTGIWGEVDTEADLAVYSSPRSK